MKSNIHGGVFESNNSHHTVSPLLFLTQPNDVRPLNHTFNTGRTDWCERRQRVNLMDLITNA